MVIESIIFFYIFHFSGNLQKITEKESSAHIRNVQNNEGKIQKRYLEIIDRQNKKIQLLGEKIREYKNLENKFQSLYLKLKENEKKNKSQVNLKNLKERLSHSLSINKLFINPVEEKKFQKIIRYEQKKNGNSRAIRHMKHKMSHGVLLEQRSDRKRLYDHNIFLRALFSGKISHKKYPNFGRLFNSSIFVDFGSAILNGQGAPTVRDIFEDKEVSFYLSKIIATDINDYNNKRTQYINIYKKKKRVLPFPVKEIDKSITRYKQIDSLLEPYLNEKISSVIFRSANSGPDLFYKNNQVKHHLKAIIISCIDKNVIYFFNRFILFKGQYSDKFHLIGTISKDIGFSHQYRPWLYIKWQKRLLKSAFTPNTDYIRISP